MVIRTHIALLASLLCLCAALDVSRPCGRRSVRPARLRAGRSSRPVAAAGDKVRLTVDLGKDGEPKGQTSVVFKPLMSRSVFVQVKGSGLGSGSGSGSGSESGSGSGSGSG